LSHKNAIKHKKGKIFWQPKVECRCYVRLDFLRQFKSDWLRRLEGLVFEKKIDYIYIYRERERERDSLKLELIELKWCPV
jgi:hypothetical protein